MSLPFANLLNFYAIHILMKARRVNDLPHNIYFDTSLCFHKLDYKSVLSFSQVFQWKEMFNGKNVERFFFENSFTFFVISRHF